MANNHTNALAHPVGERRKHRRHFVDLPVDCRVIENERKGPIQVGMAENAGIGGLSIYLNEQFPCGKQLIIELYFRDGYEFSSLKILTEVVWSRDEKDVPGYKHGLKVLRLENGGNQRFQALLKSCPMLM